MCVCPMAAVQNRKMTLDFAFSKPSSLEYLNVSGCSATFPSLPSVQKIYNPKKGGWIKVKGRGIFLSKNTFFQIIFMFYGEFHWLS